MMLFHLALRASSDSPLSSLLDTTLGDGFDYPCGDRNGQGEYISHLDNKKYPSWYIATGFNEHYAKGLHPGVDINGSGKGDTDIRQPVFAIGNGYITDATDYGAPWGNVVSIIHTYLENGEERKCLSLYAHLDTILVKKKQYVQRRTQIGTIGNGHGSFPAHLHFEIRGEKILDYPSTFWPSSDSWDSLWISGHYYDPVKFLNNHRTLMVPCLEKSLLIAIKRKYKLYHIKSGTIYKEYNIALSQDPSGPKKRQGDLKMPEGEYYICEKQQGPFYGAYAEYLGPCLLRISYPNRYDARRGLDEKVINKVQYNQIVNADNTKKIPPKNTALGGGIVIHGWKGDWYDAFDKNLTWGCISMHNSDLEKFFTLIATGTKIIIQP
jgi:murein DD-endopeptidase MepM/ murein hydrolase activator NlpD